IISGMIMDRLDHVLTSFLLHFSFCSSTFLMRWASTKGPFFSLRGFRRSPYRFFLLLRRRSTMSFCLALVLLLVRLSFVPQGLTGCRPPEVLPSPPPCG